MSAGDGRRLNAAGRKSPRDLNTSTVPRDPLVLLQRVRRPRAAIRGRSWMTIVLCGQTLAFEGGLNMLSAVDIPLAASPAPRSPQGIVGRTAPSANFMDFRFQLANQANVVTAIGARLPTDAFAYVVTPNVDHVIRVQHFRSDLWPAYRHAWMTLCDSRILARLAKWTGLVLPLVPGSDLTSALFGNTIRADDRIAFLGGSDTTIASLCRSYHLTNVVHLNPPMGFIDKPLELAQAVEFLVTTRAQYSFLAVGSPQQEIVAYLVQKRGLAIGIGLCIGASLEFLTGRQRRAPRAVQRLALEWLFRLLSNPRRFSRRYLVDGPLIIHIYREWRRHRRGDPLRERAELAAHSMASSALGAPQTPRSGLQTSTGDGFKAVPARDHAPRRAQTPGVAMDQPGRDERDTQRL